MSAVQIAMEMERLVRNELERCERAINADDKRRALSEVDDAQRKLKRLAARLRQLPSDSVSI